MNRNIPVSAFSSPLPWSPGRIANIAVITLLAGGAAMAEDPVRATSIVSAMAPKTAQSHMDAISNSLNQFLHWQMLLRILLGFGLAVGCGWFIAWQPRRATNSDASADLEETKTLILLAMVGAAVAEISKLDQNMAFVIFGIGALVRFRTVMDNPKVTGKAIMVVVVGLACGMNQWAMAAFVTLLTRALIFWLDSHVSVKFKIRVTGKHDVRLVYSDVQDFLRLHRCQMKGSSLYENKRSMLFIARVPSNLDLPNLESSLRNKLGPECNIEVRVS